MALVARAVAQRFGVSARWSLQAASAADCCALLSPLIKHYCAVWARDARGFSSIGYLVFGFALASGPQCVRLSLLELAQASGLGTVVALGGECCWLLRFAVAFVSSITAPCRPGMPVASALGATTTQTFTESCRSMSLRDVTPSSLAPRKRCQ